MTHHLRLARALAALSLAAAVGAGGAVLTAPAAAAAAYTYGQVVNYPLIFPAAAPHTLGSGSHFWAQRYNGDHHAQDIMADKMTEVYAVASGTVTWTGSSCCSITITHDDGWKSIYIHLNNDLDPDADDGEGWGIAPGIERGRRVERGQLIGWVGDSGNAEDTAPHLHFELKAPDPATGTGYYSGVYVDSFESLKEAKAAQGHYCAGEKATRVDTDGDRRIVGTQFDDVIAGTAGADAIFAGAGDDLVCGDDGDDHLEGGPGADRLLGGRGDDRLRGGQEDDHLAGGPGRDLLVASPGIDHLDGGRGRDTVTFVAAAAGVAADLAAGTAAGGATATLAGIEAARGSAHDDALTGDDRRNTLLGLGGADFLAGTGGNDRLLGGSGDDTLLGGEGDDFLDGGDGEADSADGGDGTDTCLAEATPACEA